RARQLCARSRSDSARGAPSLGGHRFGTHVAVVLDAQVLEALLVSLADPQDREFVARRVAELGNLAPVVQGLVLLSGEIEGPFQGAGEADLSCRLFPP